MSRIELARGTRLSPVPALGFSRSFLANPETCASPKCFNRTESVAGVSILIIDQGHDQLNNLASQKEN